MENNVLSSLPEIIVTTLIFFFPAFLANMAPVVLWRTKLWKKARKPVDLGKTLMGERVFGENKTFFGLIAATIGGAFGAMVVLVFLTVYGNFIQFIYQVATFWDFIIMLLCFGLIGAWMGFGAIMGDLLKSFIKRRIKIKPGQPLIFWDQVDFVIGAWVAYWLLYLTGILSNLKEVFDFSVWLLIAGMLITPLLHLTANIVAYKLKWKDVWW